MGLLDRLFGTSSPRAADNSFADSAPPSVQLHGEGRFHVSVVGESRNRISFEHILGPRTSDGVHYECDASLVLEDDNPVDDRAVRVEIEGLKVGYLSRDHARAYRDWLREAGYERPLRAQCRALVRGGWDDGEGDSGEYGVSLDLPVATIPAPQAARSRSQPRRDAHAQPSEWLNLTRRIDRSVHELLGLIKGIIADRHVTADETQLLRSWMIANPEAASAWPGNVLAERITRIYADGRADEDEREDLRLLLDDIVGGATQEAGNPATRLPLDDPPPPLRYNGSVYVFTGRFFSGTRQWCEDKVESRGAVSSSSVTRRTNYLVIGELGSRDWKHTSFGRKIQKAVEVRSDGHPLAIIAENHWADSL